MDKAVDAFIRKHTLIHNKAVVLVGVSGGPDSMALLHYLAARREQWNLRIIALTADHQLRGEESKEDVLFVKSICRDWEIETEEAYLDVNAYKAKHQAGTELAARELRYQFFEACMEKYQADYLALAHHGDDQTETILMRLARGSNPAALSGMPVSRPIKDGLLIRPLLACTKEEIQQYCEQYQIPYRLDSSNEEDTYTRNYIRLHVMPKLKQRFPLLHEHAQRFSELMKQDEAYLKDQAEKALHDCVQFNSTKKEITFEINAFTQYPIALQRRMYHLILIYLYQVLPDDLHHRHEAHFFELISSAKANSTVDFPAGLKLTKFYRHLSLSFDKKTENAFHYTLHAPGCVTLPDGSLITASFTPHLKEVSPFHFILPLQDVKLPLTVRSRKNGDKMKLRGMSGTKKVKDIFIDEKIPAHMRANWPIVEDANGSILWLIGLKKGNTSSMTDREESCIHLIYQPKSGE